MAHLWSQDEGGQWGVVLLEHEAYILVGLPSPAIQRRINPLLSGAAVLLRTRTGDADAWVLKSTHGVNVTVNSLPLYLGMRVLHDKDEIRLDGAQRLFFSTEKLARVVPFPGSEHAVYCARCKQEISTGNPAVQCPQCGTWCHQSGELCCWTYGPNCPLCDQATALDAGYRWTPEAL